MRYELWCEEKQCGDSGPMCQILDAESWQPIEGLTRPQVGSAVRVGSFSGRTFSAQDYWTTTTVQEIMVDEPNYMKFRTRNSIYEWHCI